MTNSQRTVVDVTYNGVTRRVDVKTEVVTILSRQAMLGMSMGQGLPALTFVKGKPTPLSVKRLCDFNFSLYKKSLDFWAEQARPATIENIVELSYQLDIKTDNRRFDRVKTDNLVKELDKLSKMYAQKCHDDIESWDWQSIKASAELVENFDGESVLSYYLGTCFALCPSGKYYTAFANSNVSDEEALLDEIWYEALESVADKYGGYIVSGEGDPCDILVEFPYESDDDDEEEEVTE